MSPGDAHHDQSRESTLPEYGPDPSREDDENRLPGRVEEMAEGNPAAERLPMAQLFASKLGITLTDLKPEYHVEPEEKEWAWKRYWRKDLPRIGLQFMASAYYRSYPDMGKVLLGLSKKSQVFLLGSPGQIVLEDPMQNIVNLMDDKLTYRQSAAVVSTCDACVSPDSALVHLCSALDIPCVALYGPFPRELRVTSDLTYAFNGKAPCAPCFFHAEIPDQFPAGMPCTEKKRCVALESIDPERVVQKTLSLAKTLERPS
jgi:ADP-heptose:LPS heptosyltransferase